MDLEDIIYWNSSRLDESKTRVDEMILRWAQIAPEDVAVEAWTGVGVMTGISSIPPISFGNPDQASTSDILIPIHCARDYG